MNEPRHRVAEAPEAFELPATPDAAVPSSPDATSQDQATTLEDGMLLDYISNQPVKDTAKEQVRQRIARALFHEYGISVDDMARDFRMTVDGKRKRLDIAIFEPGAAHAPEHLRRIVLCEKEPAIGRKGVVKIRSPEEAEKDFALLKAAMAEAESCLWGLWTNGLDFFYFEKETTRFDVKFRSMGDWPLADETIGTRLLASGARLRKAEPEMLKAAFRRCHNFIHGNEGMSKDAAFWQFLYLIFCKMHDERHGRGADGSGRDFRFWVGPTEQFDDAGRRQIRARIESLFTDVKQRYAGSGIFSGNETITLSDRALSFMVSELAKYDFTRTDVDAKGVAYQEIVGDNLRGDRGQYFTPRGAVKLMVRMLDPKPNERVLDPACGTGGFLAATVAHQLARYKRDTQSGADGAEPDTADALSAADAVRRYVQTNLFGCDFDPALVRATTMNLLMAAGDRGHVFHLDSLSFPQGHLDGLPAAKQEIPFGTIDVLLTNPPFGSDIPITDP
ncbi:MAG: N-6 DNA methylase, partial [Gammaproteobacteria bacterium]|nr:N-6 DNA methylase [Gammaproteobacteria bacterium]